MICTQNLLELLQVLYKACDTTDAKRMSSASIARIFSLAARTAICEGAVMHLLPRTIPLVLAFALVACGGSTPPPNDKNTASDSEQASGAGSSSAATEAEHKSFMTECVETPELKDYCSCSWDTITKSTTAEERKDIENPNTKKAMGTLAEKCGSKLPKSVIKGSFVKNCAKSPMLMPFCECSFNFFDSKGLLNATEEDAAKAQGEMKAACSKELSELGKVAFLQGCGEKQTEAVCKCTYGALEKKHGKEKLQSFLETGGDDVKKAVKSAGTTCGAK